MTGERIVVIGPPCSGKTTTARAIAARLRVPHVELDALWWDADWTEAGAERFKERLADVLAEPRWVLDGNYFDVGARDVIYPRADTIVWLDQPRWVTVPRAAKRTLRRVVLKQELWSGNRERWGNLRPIRFMRVAMGMHPAYNRSAEALRDDPSTAHVEWVRLRDRGAIERWLAGRVEV